MTKDQATPNNAAVENRQGLSPSEFMRKLHPEYYSDSSGRTVYQIERETLEYHLDSITQRNETHDFEIFCRKLCERAICPNLRPATGSEGGGDSKADTETFAVADEIFALTYIGKPNAGSERWAFAFSAKQSWTTKIRQDVGGLAATGRDYARIICVTSRFARAKTRAQLEDDLTKQHGIPVQIHDRSWIVKEIIENNREDLAFHYLRIGRELSDIRPLGPNDYSRTQELEDIERSFDDPEAFRGTETQMVTEALVAAKRSRQLQRSRVETDGRFERAKQVAQKYGTRRQQLKIQYEAILTAFWWFDDFETLNSAYDVFEATLIADEHVKNVEYLVSLCQLLLVSVVHGHLSVEDSELIKRTNRLGHRLEAIERDSENPNSALTATTSLLLLKLIRAGISRGTDQLPAIWVQFSKILDRAKPLSEFDADGLVKLITNVAQVAGDSTEYNTLIETTAKFVSERKGAADGARVLVQRAKQLDPSQHLECIRLLGKATPILSKAEYTEELIGALPFLALAYRKGGLLWAARATCLMAAALILIRFEDDGEVSLLMVWTIELWAWLSLQLRHIPDLLSATSLLDAVGSGSILSEKARIEVSKKRENIELALASQLLSLSNDELGKLDNLADALDRLELITARTALLYSLGHVRRLRDDGSIPKEESPEDVANLFSTLANDTISDRPTGPLICNSERG